MVTMAGCCGRCVVAMAACSVGEVREEEGENGERRSSGLSMVDAMEEALGRRTL